jgi:Domain of Unknown Function with PDB structure (DUF3857)/Transglutaminase-like superfamily
MKLFQLILCVLLPKMAYSQFAAKLIAEDLKAKAHAVVRYHETTFAIENIGEATFTTKAAITILDEKGDHFATMVIPYNKFTKVKEMQAQIYDANDKSIKKLKRSDIENYNTGSGANDIDDSFVKYAQLSYPIYPYTIVYELQYTTKNMMFYPTWEAYPGDALETAVEKSSFSISYPQNMKVRFQEIKMPTSVVLKTEGEKTVMYWETKNLKAVDPEPNSPSAEFFMPRVITAPSEFMVEGLTGKAKDWNDIGKFIGTLNKDRDQLPAEAIAKIKELVQNESDEVQKVKKIYEYLQANTRYVSIQLGIGGWQTMKATEVATKGYGDCKALSNYTMAMLKAVGIKSNQVLVKAGGDEDDIRADFPSFQFNHVFVCVPLKKDTLWLECTSQTNAFGYIGSFTGGRHAVLITDEGGQLIQTKKYKSTDNQQIRAGNIILADNGDATATVQTLFTGEQSETRSQLLHSLDDTEQKKWITKHLSLASAEINSFSLKEKSAFIPSVLETLALTLKNVSSKSGTRLFLTPNLLNKFETAPIPNPNRKNDVQITMDYFDSDSISFQIPKGYSIEFMPEATLIKTKFGTYSSKILFKDEKLIYVRKMTMNKGTYPVSAYQEYVDFKKKLFKADKTQVVLVAK